MKIYVTKYALTRGILEYEVVDDSVRPEPGQVHIVDGKYVSRNSTDGYLWVNQSDWFYDLDKARERVRALIAAKIKSLEKQIKKLKALDSSLT